MRGCASFSFYFVGGIWDLIALIPDHLPFCLLCFLLITNIKRMVFIGFDSCRNCYVSSVSVTRKGYVVRVENTAIQVNSKPV